ncbi:DUF1048 domain-containing protein [Clostridium tyrobutyricum]|uniref:DUF1048 domain-containing protein n=1 Tax=Clostridium tyrobutyricum TaxID=1519 RepID=UPI00189D20B6|nr:DUF1048 domain-containing protein [Clostridium tyrobutyricum]MBV4440609.1 DUF1048 domain-containing protein [Clostridium tyrobutyricum]MBV4447152.1 DUF1048 domain-containing protein [Clostridium tyrobutyricum]
MKNYIQSIFESKKRYKDYKKEKEKLPDDYEKAINALEKYMWSFAKSGNFMTVLEEVLQLFMESSFEKVPLSEVIGEDPVKFADTIMEQFPQELWLIKSREKLRDEIKKIGG